MTEYGTGCLVRSLAGHDKGTYYIIVREDARYVYLADGRTKTAAKPKRKKRKHEDKEEINELIQNAIEL